MITTTLKDLSTKEYHGRDWSLLMESLKKTNPDNEPIPIEHILNTLGLHGALRTLKHVKGCERILRLFAASCARRVAKCNQDPRVMQAVDAAANYADGICTVDILNAARNAVSRVEVAKDWDASSSGTVFSASNAKAAAWHACQNDSFQAAFHASHYGIISAACAAEDFKSAESLELEWQIEEMRRLCMGEGIDAHN